MAAPATLSATQLLRQQHQEIEDLFARTLDASSEARAELFDRLRATLAAHETTEEIFVHPLARRAGEEAQRIVAARLAEERAAGQTLTELEDLGPAGDQFGAHLLSFRRAVLEHAEREELELFPIIDSQCTPEELADLADAILSCSAVPR